MKKKSIHDDATVMITGGTGSFGKKYAEYLLTRTKAKKIIVFSRDEMKQYHMANHFNNDSRLRFFLGDVRDLQRVSRAVEGVDTVVHAAATKIVTTAEYNPFECVKTNIIGGMNVIEACLDRRVKNVVALSTDKASSPVNLYGATKLTSDKLFVGANVYVPKDAKTKFSVVRYGNVMGSRGSVIPYFMNLKNRGADYLPITDKSMTRFMITLDEGIELVESALANMIGGEIFVKKIPSMNIVDIAKCINDQLTLKIVGVRPGEKIHEQMIGPEDARLTFEFDNYYKITPQIVDDAQREAMGAGGRKVASDFTYSSDNNEDWMSIETLKGWINDNEDYLQSNF